MRRHGREAEGDGLLNRYTGYTCIEGSNPSVSANFQYEPSSSAFNPILMQEAVSA